MRTHPRHPTGADAGGCGHGGAGQSEPAPPPPSPPAFAPHPRPGRPARPLPFARKRTSRRRAQQRQAGARRGRRWPEPPTLQLSPERGLLRRSRRAGDALAVGSRASSSRRSQPCSLGAGGAPRAAAELAGAAGTHACRAPPTLPRGRRAAPRNPLFARSPATPPSAGRRGSCGRQGKCGPGEGRTQLRHSPGAAADACPGQRTACVLPNPASHLAPHLAQSGASLRLDRFSSWQQ